MADSALRTVHFPREMFEKTEPFESLSNLAGFSLKKAKRVMEKAIISKALVETGGNRTRAAELLEISHPSLLSKIKDYEIEE